MIRKKKRKSIRQTKQIKNFVFRKSNRKQNKPTNKQTEKKLFTIRIECVFNKNKKRKSRKRNKTNKLYWKYKDDVIGQYHYYRQSYLLSSS